MSEVLNRRAVTALMVGRGTGEELEAASTASDFPNFVAAHGLAPQLYHQLRGRDLQHFIPKSLLAHLKKAATSPQSAATTLRPPRRPWVVSC